MAHETVLSFKYVDGVVPEGYRCTACGASGSKLWRDYNTCADVTDLLCAVCAGKRYDVDVSKIDHRGTIRGRRGRTDQIGRLVPAVPTEDGETFWGYTSVPEEGCRWWADLPSHPTKQEAA
jgi:hypothetical protein